VWDRSQRPLREYVEALEVFLRDSARERGRRLPEWKRVLVAEDEGATGSLRSAWTPLVDSQPLLDRAKARSTRDWVNVVVLKVEDESLLIAIEYLTDGTRVCPADQMAVNIAGPPLRWLDALPAAD
jgi:hypothetical protein